MFDPGELPVEAIEFDRQAICIDAELVQDGGVPVADVMGMLGGGEAEFVAGAVG